MSYARKTRLTDIPSNFLFQTSLKTSHPTYINMEDIMPIIKHLFRTKDELSPEDAALKDAILEEILIAIQNKKSYIHDER